MSSFLKLVFALVAQIIYNVADWLIGFVKGFIHVFFTAWVEYASIFMSYFQLFSLPLKILSIIFALILIAVPVLIIYLIVKRIALHIRLKHENGDSATLYREISRLNRQVLDLIDEKNKILALKVSSVGAGESIPYMGASALIDGEGGVAPAGGAAASQATMISAAPVPLLDEDGNPVIGEDGQPVMTMPAAGGGSLNIDGAEITANIKHEVSVSDPDVVRFPKLTLVDEKYADYEEPVYDNKITLEEFTEGFRMFAAGTMKLYYTPEIVRRFVAGMASSKLLILEGISGTGKTSLPYSFSRYLDNPATIVSVQPSYRDRTELLGYFNEFSKRFNETEFLRALYEANYRKDASFIVLDEMNLARIEYYFAEMLSVLEMPSHDEWILDLVPTAWPRDPEKIMDGKITVADSTWFIGTANNDDSTFTITDKVYDRAIPIEINERAQAFECKEMPRIHVTTEHLEKLFQQAREDNPISDSTLAKMTKLDEYLQTRFKLAFGNRIMKQMYDFIPVYVACGGTELGGMDYIIARKVLKKFESMNVMFVRDEIKGLIEYMDKLFGKTQMPDSKDYLTRIQNLY